MICKESDAILALIQISFTRQVRSLPECLDWGKIVDLATEQGVVGVCYDAIELLPSAQRPDLENLMELAGLVSIIEAAYKDNLRITTELSQFYLNNGIKMMILKGYGLSLRWPIPEHRPVGDIDVYFFKINNSNGNGDKERKDDTEFREKLPLYVVADKMVEKSLGIEIDREHHHHTCFKYKGVTIENHYDFINVFAHRDAPMIEAKLKELAVKSVKKNTIAIEGVESLVYLPSADFNALFLIRHLGQHFAGERITLRQLLDWHLFLKNENYNINWIDINQFLKTVGLYEFKECVNRICVYCFEDSSINLSPLEKRILNDVLSPEFSDKGTGYWFMFKRWKANIWKHRLVYNENLITMFFTLALSHLRKPKLERV